MSSALRSSGLRSLCSRGRSYRRRRATAAHPRLATESTPTSAASHQAGSPSRRWPGLPAAAMAAPQSSPMTAAAPTPRPPPSAATAAAYARRRRSADGAPLVPVRLRVLVHLAVGTEVHETVEAAGEPPV